MTAPDRNSAHECETAAFAPVPRSADVAVYAGIIVCTAMNALMRVIPSDADVVPYFDLSDAIKGGLWHSVVNAYWFPLYPAFLTAARCLFGFRPQYDLMAARLMDAVVQLFFVLASVALASCARRLILVRGVKPELLLPPRILYLWVAVFAFFFVSQDMFNTKPDALLCSLMILTVAATLLAVARNSLLLYAAVGLCGGLAYWAKAFAFPFFFMWILLICVASIRSLRVLKGLALAVFVFGLIAGPYIWQISALKGRFTFGESGRLDMAWYVNGADRFNPVADPTVWKVGSARAELKHPGELLAKYPEVAYYGGDKVYGSTPQWDDPSYWADGLAPRFVFDEFLLNVKVNLSIFGTLLLMRLQALVLAAALFCWGLRLRRTSFAHPMAIMVFVQALGAIGLYALVVLEGRFVSFALVMVGAAYAACAVGRISGANYRSLHAAVLLLAAILLVAGLQDTLRGRKVAKAHGAQPLKGIYNAPLFDAGNALHGLYPNGGEVACLGDEVCFGDTFWARYGGMRMTATIDTGNGRDVRNIEVGCEKIEANPAVLKALREHNVKAIVGFFDRFQPCSAHWQPLGGSDGYFILPLEGAAEQPAAPPKPFQPI